MNRLPGLDLLRAVAIAWVMLYHLTSYGPRLPAVIEFGFMGVDLFFVLSGFLIGWQLLKPYTCGQQPLWAQFFVRRAFRVLPAYLTVLALYFALPAVRESPGIQPLWQFLTFTQNMFADYFRARAFSHAWSLCIEEHFYLLLPPVVWLLARKPTLGKVAAVALATLVGGMLLRGWLWQHEVAPFLDIGSGEGNFFDRYIENIYNPTYTRLDGLLAGVMLAVVKGFRPVWWSWATARSLWFLAAGVAGVYTSMCLQNPGYLHAVIGFPLLSASLAAIVLAAASPHSWPGRWRVPGAAPIAAMAFSLYLTHKAVYHLVRDNLGAHLQHSNLLALCIYIGAALAVGALLYLAVERPGMRLRERLLRGRAYRNGEQVAA
jgi:peptidoglycan/LPS O-acetylase OafA/YrhL